MAFRWHKRFSYLAIFVYLLFIVSCVKRYAPKIGHRDIEKIKKQKSLGVFSGIKKSNPNIKKSKFSYAYNDQYLNDFKIKTNKSKPITKAANRLVSYRDMKPEMKRSVQKIFKNKSQNIFLTSFSNIDGWNQDNFVHALESFLHSCTVIKKKKPNTKVATENVDLGTVAHWRQICSSANKVYKKKNNQSSKEFFEKNFTPFLVAKNNKQKNTLFTSYYIYDIKINKTRTNKYRYPIFKTPNACRKSNSTCLSRCEVDFYGKAGLKNVIAWTDDFVDRYLLHIQGSGIGVTENGSLIPLLFQSKNNKPYRSFYNSAKHTNIGKILNYNELLNWMRLNPTDGIKMFCANPSYVFFSKTNKPFFYGAQGSKLTPSRSVAIDDTFLPYGVPLWINTQISSDVSINNSHQMKRLFIAQDTGAAIDDPFHIDLYMGFGEKANKFSHAQRYNGSYFALIPDIVLKNYI